MSAALAARVRAAGLRATPARLLILEVLERLGGHRSADEIAAALDLSGRPIARASLYHVLGALSRAGLVMVAAAAPGPARYESAPGWHGHLVCRACGTIVDLPAEGRRPCPPGEIPGGAVVEQVEVLYRGLCGACAAS